MSSYSPAGISRRGLIRAMGAGAAALAGRVPLVTAAVPPGAEDAPALPTPTPRQLAWQEAELTLFLHFGVNTFTDREWGDGKEDPRVFNPARLDAGQWAAVAKEAGFRYVILTAKHHDGFCLWPSRHTEHSVKNSPWRGGKGDVVRETADACRQAGLKLGLYLSPWDRHDPRYGDSPAYNAHFRAQLTELLSDYGEVAEVWFDGACGEGPNGKKQVYDWESYYAVIRKLQPDALIAICGPDVRWVGNETGVARETEWSIQPVPGAAGEVSAKARWYPAECDVSIRPGWFWHRSQDDKVKSLPQLLDIYHKSVGRNSVLLLNVPPNDQGLIADPDVARLGEFRQALDRAFATDLARGRPATASSSRPGAPAGSAVDGRPDTWWAPDPGDAAPRLEVDLGRPTALNVAMVQEYIPYSQRVMEYSLEVLVGGEWKPLAKGTTIGHKKLDRFPEVTATKVRLTLGRWLAPPLIRRLGVFRSE